MNNKPTGIHHVTAIGGEPQRNVDFYVGVLGLRMVKKTVNFDDRVSGNPGLTGGGRPSVSLAGV